MGTNTSEILPLSAKKIGVMQGRLLPKYNGRYQAHPIGYWEDEFEIAASLGLDLIEFILDYNDYEDNPLMSVSGCREIKEISNQSGVHVKTVCADYFMEAPLHSTELQVATLSAAVLRELISNAQNIGITDLIIPLVDQSSVATLESQDRFINALTPFLIDLEAKNINLNLETDLGPSEFKNLLDQIDSKRVTVNYDTGNSAGLGYDPAQEFAAYGHRITDIHIKDRVNGGSSVCLGQGSADFAKIFKCVQDCGYNGPFIMQAFRDDEGLEIFKTQLTWLRSLINSIDESNGI
jgi:sugar phosphate isomerase/epimerase